MAALEAFSRIVEDRLAAARREPRWQPAETAQFMAELESRRRQFEQHAIRIVQTLIRPRMQVVASYFPNSATDRTERSDRCAYWFGYCERFPTDAKVEIAVEHDERIENIVMHYELHISPVFLKFDPHDKMSTPLGAMDERAITDWVEAKLLAFLDTYLRLDRGQDNFDDEVVVDPVCGMRINRLSASTTMDYRGHPYFFCSDECRQRFSKEPMQYIRFETG